MPSLGMITVCMPPPWAAAKRGASWPVHAPMAAKRRKAPIAAGRPLPPALARPQRWSGFSIGPPPVGCWLIRRVVERFEDGAGRPPSPAGTVLDQAEESASHRLQPGQLLVDVLHFGLCKCAHFALSLAVATAEADELLDLLQCEAEVLSSFDAPDEGNGLLWVHPVTGGASFRLGEQASPLVSTERAGVDACVVYPPARYSSPLPPLLH